MPPPGDSPACSDSTSRPRSVPWIPLSPTTRPTSGPWSNCTTGCCAWAMTCRWNRTWRGPGTSAPTACATPSTCAPTRGSTTMPPSAAGSARWWPGTRSTVSAACSIPPWGRTASGSSTMWSTPGRVSRPPTTPRWSSPCGSPSVPSSAGWPCPIAPSCPEKRWRPTGRSSATTRSAPVLSGWWPGKRASGSNWDGTTAISAVTPKDGPCPTWRPSASASMISSSVIDCSKTS